MTKIIFSLASFLIAAFAFGFGAAKLFRAKRPLYLRLLVCAAGCFATEQLSCAVNLWCGSTETVGVGVIGIFGCIFFLLSANFGTLDKIVDDGRDSKKARALALIAPLGLALFICAAFIAWMKQDIICAVVWLLILLPSLPASYFNLKHILLPLDPFEFLRVTKPCNICALFFYTLTAEYVIASAVSTDTVCGILTVLMSLSMLALSLCAVRGAKKWGI